MLTLVRVFDAVRHALHTALRRFGYVTIEEVRVILEAKNQVEEQLLHKTRNLEHQLGIRGRLESEIEFLRKLELHRRANTSIVQQAADRLDSVADQLIELAREHWPDAYFLRTTAEQTASGP
jgi:hypothetical protein